MIIYLDIRLFQSKINPSTLETPGVGYIILGELARADINIYEAVNCTPEFLIFIEEKKLLKAYQVLFELVHKQAKK